MIIMVGSKSADNKPGPETKGLHYGSQTVSQRQKEKQRQRQTGKHRQTDRKRGRERHTEIVEKIERDREEDTGFGVSF